MDMDKLLEMKMSLVKCKNFNLIELFTIIIIQYYESIRITKITWSDFHVARQDIISSDIQ